MENQLLMIKNVLLLSPLEQFDLTLKDIRQIILTNTSASVILTEEWIQSVRKEHAAAETSNDMPVVKIETASSAAATTSFTDLLKTSLLSNNCYYKHSNNNKQEEEIFCSCDIVCSEDDDGNNNNNNNNNNNEFTILLTRKNHKNIQKCFAGSWTGVVKLRLLSSSNSTATTNNETPSTSCHTECTLGGTVQMKAHAFEYGNVELSSTIHIDPPQFVSSSSSLDATLLCQAIVNRFISWDEQILKSLDEFYNTMEDPILKNARRVLPHSRKRMEWNIQSHRVVSNLSNLNI